MIQDCDKKSLGSGCSLKLSVLVFALLFVAMPLVLGAKTAIKNNEIVRNDYTIQEICKILNRSLSTESKIISHPNPSNWADTGYSYFLQIYNLGDPFYVGEIFNGEHEYRFALNNFRKDSYGSKGIRFFRDKKNVIKIVCEYEEAQSAHDEILDSLNSTLSAGGGFVIEDFLDKKEGYVLLSGVPKLVPNKDLDPFYILRFKQDKTHYFEAIISKSIIKKAERQRLDKMIDKQGWKKYYDVAPPGEYLPGSGPGQGVRPGTGEVMRGYGE